ncbi:hypothetical protein NQ317_016856 [Molorchus minor]|uniref:Nuclease HARBI1 n=1 Tax=Molorchus minor TaxID=1323400 RepID=A0ABQ9JIV9_9CUCU|nr:hypothetical protein NQ317_016856 [Molorchus minor]
MISNLLSSSVLSYSLSTSSEEEENDMVLQIPRPKNKNYITETVSRYNNEVFMEHFRVSKQVYQSIVDAFQHSEHFKTTQSGRFGKISGEVHIFIVLWFAGHQTASFRDVADRFDITISSLFRNINRRSLKLYYKMAFKRREGFDTGFFEERGFTGVVGVIDGSHIKIDRPSVADSYLNRKHFFPSR